MSKFSEMTALVVDDSLTARKFSVDALKSIGFVEILQANDGKIALDLAQANDLAIVLCDHNMPGLTGAQLLERFKTDPELQWVPFIAVSAETREDIIRRIIASGADGFLRKPFSAKKIREMINSVLEQRDNPVNSDLMAAHYLIQAGQYSAALCMLYKIHGIGSRLAPWWYYVGECLRGKCDFDNAIKSYERAVQLFPNYYKALMALVRIYETNRDKNFEYERAYFKYLERSVEVNPHNVKGRLNLFRSWNERGDREKAKKVLLGTLPIVRDDQIPDDLIALARALIKFEKEEEEEAEDTLIDQEQKRKRESFSLITKAKLLLEDGAKVHAKDTHYLNQMTMIYHEIGETKKALNFCDRNLEKAPDDPNLLFNKAALLKEFGKYAEAWNVIQLAYELAPNDQNIREAYVFLEDKKNRLIKGPGPIHQKHT
ncbi:MAG: response regulator [Deltaproteobacteria bacterium]|nr:response regulator [Deltaproteobacteria bacterium]